MIIKPLNGKVALITGGARGIGKAIAIKFAQAGADVAINYFNSYEEASRLVKELQALGVRSCAIKGNVADPLSVSQIFSEFKNSFDRLDILINNAASGVLKPIMTMTTKHWRWCLETNALALPLLLKEAQMLMPPGSRVIALSSLGSQRAIPDYGFIGASKAALEAVVRSLSVELAPLGISLNTVSAGVVDTEALKCFPNRQRLLDESRAKTLTGENIQAEDVANVTYLLCLPEAEAIRGQTIRVDAGYSIVG